MQDESQLELQNRNAAAREPAPGKRPRKKLLPEYLNAEKQYRYCVKKFCGCSIKRDINCWQIASLFFLFILGSLASHMVLLSTVVVWFVYAKDRGADKTSEEQSLEVYREMLIIELITMGISIFFTIFIGYMYEIWSRKKVLFICFFFLAIGMVLPETDLVEEQDRLYWIGRIATAVLA